LVGAERGRRRVPGLRREELANLAGVSYSWYTRLEQGREVHATAEVIDSIGAALRLGEDEHRHLRRLAGLPARPVDGRDEDLDVHIHELLNCQLPAPAYVIGTQFDYLAWNRALTAVYYDIGTLPPARRNVLWVTFMVPEVRTSLVAWEDHARSVIAQFRAEAAAHPADQQFSAMANELMSSSPEFREWWETHDVARAGIADQAFHHSEFGMISTRLIQLRLIDRPSLKVVIHLPATPEDSRTLESLIGRAP